ncbi:N-acetylglucosamine-6-phosphate deacetylase [Cucumibacter marinus]|uniref:N-acetylglucosamine-6-phosphate deacetylase n=1 Tax=Cucumibacter marinus TaxID=1121252 RepID=UPI0003FAC028|nr:N-acetylglucosamine-6-phosphate deacetylase [Cucumibacter marinus]
MNRLLRNATLFDGTATLGRRSVLIEDGRIAGIFAADQDLPQADIVEDLGGLLLAPGFIDTQVNGGGGVMLNSEQSVDGLSAMVAGHRRYGTTTLIATMVTDTLDVMRAAADAVRAGLQAGLPGLRGIHFEGPCFNPLRKGVHRPDLFRPLDDDLMKIYTGAGLGAVIVTLAPEQVDTARLAELAEAGVNVSAGHTGGSYEDIEAALAAGLRGFTHIYNAMTPMTGREPGVVGAALNDTNTWCGIIIDGYHLHDATALAAIHSKPRGKMMLVTDAMATVGARDKRFSLYGHEIRAIDGRCALPDGTLAGSDLDMMGAVRNTHRRLGIPLEEALRMASLYPAAFLRLDDRIGRIRPGFDADMVLIDPESLEVRRTWIAGEGEDAQRLAA